MDAGADREVPPARRTCQGSGKESGMMAPPVGVCFLIDELAAAGTETQLLALLHRLDRRRVEPFLCLLRGDSERSRALEPDCCPVLRLGIGSLRSPATLPRLWRLARFLHRHRIDVLQVYFPDSTYVGVPVGRLAGVPTVVRTRNNLGHALGHLDRFLGRLLNRLTTATVANCEAARLAILEAEGPRPESVVVLENGVDVARFDAIPPLEDSPTPLRRVAALANLRRVKGLDVLIEAGHRLVRVHPDLTVRIGGEGPARGNCSASSSASDWWTGFACAARWRTCRPSWRRATWRCCRRGPRECRTPCWSTWRRDGPSWQRTSAPMAASWSTVGTACWYHRTTRRRWPRRSAACFPTAVWPAGWGRERGSGRARSSAERPRSPLRGFFRGRRLSEREEDGVKSRLHYWRRCLWDYVRYNAVCGRAASHGLGLLAALTQSPLRRLARLARAIRVSPRRRLLALRPTIEAELSRLDPTAIDWRQLGSGPVPRTDIPKALIIKPPVSPRKGRAGGHLRGSVDAPAAQRSGARHRSPLRTGPWPVGVAAARPGTAIDDPAVARPSIHHAE